MAQRGGAPGGPKVKRVMTQAINLIFEFLKNVRHDDDVIELFTVNVILSYITEGACSNMAVRKRSVKDGRSYHCKPFLF